MPLINRRTRPDLIPCRFYDAQGKEVYNVIQCDTTTGQFIVWMEDAHGQPLRAENELGEHIVKIPLWRPPPIRVVPDDPYKKHLTLNPRRA